MSSTQHWERVKKLLDAVWEMDETQRSAYLDEHCGDDQEVRRRVDNMLVAGDDLTPVFPTMREEPNQVGRMVGPFRLVRELGAGGMGSVYLGVRDDGDFRWEAAVKLIKQGLDSKDIINRFKRERRILAGLAHPNIARLLDGGSTPEGQPWFAMEYVQGKPIDVYCDENKFSIIERLHLFLKVCSAVQFTNQNLIIHRDLKPSNILIDDSGVPKLLDFGIAKFVESGHTQVQASTIEGMRPMTPLYASPEQIKGEAITTASDVYALGLLLYLLLTGHSAHRVSSPSPLALEKVICETIPATPSSVVLQSLIRTTRGGTETLQPHEISSRRGMDPARLGRRLSGELDNIVMRALRKEPGKRYASASHFADDIRRHLSGFPVLAHQGNWRYNARKFINRNKLSMAFGSAFVLFLILFGTTMAVQRQQIIEERDKARNVAQFLVNLFRIADPSGDQEDTVDALEVVSMQRVLLGDNHPQVADSLFDLGAKLNARSDREAALPLFREALEIRRTNFGEQNEAVARTRFELAHLLHELGFDNEAELEFSRARSIWKQLNGSLNAKSTHALLGLAAMQTRRGRCDRAVTLYRQALGEWIHMDGEDNLRVAATRQNLGRVLCERGEFDEGLALFDEALGLFRAILGERHQSTARCLYQYGGYLSQARKLGESERALREAIDIFDEWGMQGQSARVKGILSVCLREQRRYDEAGVLLQASDRTLRDEPAETADISLQLNRIRREALVRARDRSGTE